MTTWNSIFPSLWCESNACIGGMLISFCQEQMAPSRFPHYVPGDYGLSLSGCVHCHLSVILWGSDLWCVSGSCVSIVKWYLNLAYLFLVYLLFFQLFMFCRSGKDCLLRTLSNHKQKKNPFSSTKGEGLHMFSTSDFKQTLYLNCWGVWVSWIWYQSACFLEIKCWEAFIISQEKK